jgi:hypothetical protein
MSCCDPRAVPALPLPGELKLQPVRRLPADPPDGARLEDAVPAAIKAAPGISDPLHVFADHLRSLPASFRLFAAVDQDGAVRATSASGTFGTEATVDNPLLLQPSGSRSLEAAERADGQRDEDRQQAGESRNGPECAEQQNENHRLATRARALSV